MIESCIKLMGFISIDVINYERAKKLNMIAGFVMRLNIRGNGN